MGAQDTSSTNKPSQLCYGTLQDLKAILQLATTNMESADGVPAAVVEMNRPVVALLVSYGLGVMSKGCRNSFLPQGGDMEVPSVMGPGRGPE